MKQILFIAIYLITFHAQAIDSCLKDWVKVNQLKPRVIYSATTLTKQYDSNPELNLNQFEELGKDLEAVRALSDLMNNSIKYCADGRVMTKEMYSFEDKKNSILLISDKEGFEQFSKRYIIPYDNWAEALKVLEKDILKKRSEVKLAFNNAINKQTEKQKIRKEKLSKEAKELAEMKALNESLKMKVQENDNLEKSIASDKYQNSHSAYFSSQSVSKQDSNPQKNTYTAGQSLAYVERNSLFCMTESQFDYQFRLLSQGIKKVANGCYETNQNVDVVVLDFGMLGKSKVKEISTETVIWVTSEAVHYR